ncbi:MAG: LacI family transcriptional regulator [Boseongicola sp. SB0673_bin_14]|nr:LacI family transcriptional regulator [Boseongicola sp. SB0673_bin_14]
MGRLSRPNKDRTLRISKETRARVEDTLIELGCSPNVVAQSLASSRSGTIAVVVHDISDPKYGAVLRGAQQETARQGMAVLLGDASTGSESNARLARMIRGGGVDGLILQGAGENSDSQIAAAVRKAVPIVLLHADMEIDARLVCLPDKEAALLATGHLRDLGHQCIGCLATESGLTCTDARLSGWRQATGTDADDSLIVHASPNATQGELGMQEPPERRSGITAVVCFNVVSAVCALRQI